MTTTKPVRWTDDEKAALLAEVITTMRAKPALPKNAAISAAQRKVLPADRRRVLTTIAKVKDWLILPDDLATRTGHHPPAPPKARGPSHNPDGTRKDGRGKVFWTPLEREVLARGAAKALHLGHTSSNVDALRLAEQELPEHRQRHLTSTGSLKEWFPAALKTATKALIEAEAKVQSETELERKETPVPSLDQRQPAIEPAPAPVPVPALTDSALSASLGTLREVFVDALAGIFQEALIRAVRQLASEPVHAESPRPDSDARPAVNGVAVPVVERLQSAPPRAHRPSVLVAGLRGAQKTLIEAEFGHRLDLRYYAADESKDQLRKLADAADVSVAFTDFLSHSHTDIMSSRAGRYLPVGGGMTRLKQTLAELVGP